MGSCGSKEDENEVQSSFDPKNIYYDINGNLRYGIVLNDVIEEMRRMIVNDSIQDGVKTWYIIDSSWLSSWLYFVHYDKYVSPCPGPCRNDDLLTYDHSLQKWVPKKNLVLATKDHPGHYCKINKETWSLFQECYEHSGPTITVTSDAKSKDLDTDTSNWVIDQSQCAEAPILDEAEISRPPERDEQIIKAESTTLAPLSIPKKKLPKDPRESAPPSEFTMEDGTITRSTLLDIQKFFGLSQPPSSIEESKAFEHRYSENLINSKNEDVDTAEIPKNANEAVSVWLFGENNLLP